MASFYKWHKTPPILYKNGNPVKRVGRKPGKEPVQYRLRFPPYLKDSVSGKQEKKMDAVCIQEMTVMMACLKKNEFKESGCAPEISAFKKCLVDAQ
ncbi:unnamed protein product, partial [Darwinula stevensoni]